jgi:hypothetical protein
MSPRETDSSWVCAVAAPVDAQCIEQLRSEHDIAVLAALTSSDMYDHPLAVDIAYLLIFRCATSARRAPVA